MMIMSHVVLAEQLPSCFLWFAGLLVQMSLACVQTVSSPGLQQVTMRPWLWTPWSCLHGCDKASTCLAVFTTKLSERWTCWMIEGGTGLGFTASSIKVAPTQINAYLWAWTTLPGVKWRRAASLPVVCCCLQVAQWCLVIELVQPAMRDRLLTPRLCSALVCCR